MMEFIRDPEHRVKAALYLLGASIVGWPATALTVFKNEPQGILGLSWFAIILTAVNILATTDVRKESE